VQRQGSSENGPQTPTQTHRFEVLEDHTLCRKTAITLWSANMVATPCWRFKSGGDFYILICLSTGQEGAIRST